MQICALHLGCGRVKTMKLCKEEYHKFVVDFITRNRYFSPAGALLNDEVGQGGTRRTEVDVFILTPRTKV